MFEIFSSIVGPKTDNQKGILEFFGIINANIFLVIVFQSVEAQVSMDSFKSARSIRGGEEVEVSIPFEYDGSVHEAGWHHDRLHEKAMLGSHRPPLSRHGAQQKIRPREYNLSNYV